MSLDHLDALIREKQQQNANINRNLRSLLFEESFREGKPRRAASAQQLREPKPYSAIESLIDVRRLYSARVRNENYKKYRRPRETTVHAPNPVIKQKRELIDRLESTIMSRNAQIKSLQEQIRAKQCFLRTLRNASE